MDDDWIECSHAYPQLKARFRSHNPMTVRKAIIGMIKAGELPVICQSYSEAAIIFLPDNENSRSDPWGPHQPDSGPPCDFWRYCMAITDNADGCFSVGNFGNDIPMLSSALPYRFFKWNYQWEHHTARLIQSAWQVSFSRPHLESLFADRRWSNIWPKKAEPKKPGRKMQWQWDAVKAALTVEMAHNPKLLDAKPAEIVRKMEELFDIFQPQGGQPDRSDLYEYAEKVFSLGKPNDPAP